MKMKFKIISIILFLCLIVNISQIPENGHQILNHNVMTRTFSSKEQAINNISLAENAIFNATIKLQYLESINGIITDLVGRLNFAINLLNNASEMLNMSNYNYSVYLSKMALGNVTLLINDINIRIYQTNLYNQQSISMFIITVVIVSISITIAGILIYILIKKYKEKKFLNMKITLPEGDQ
ncbi:MAG: hypothetical protein ACTSWR_04905 [Candidatus Helarchaeota archaeon]